MADPYLSSVVSTFPVNSGNANINPLLVFGFRWGLGGAGAPANVTYSFPTYGSLWHTDYATYLDNEPFNGFTPFSAAQQTAAVAALNTWAEVANITFQQVDDGPGDTDVGDIRFGNSASVTQSSAAAWAYFPFDGFDSFEYPESGDVWFDAAYAPNLQLNPGQFGFSTLVHEIGHAIGLDHPFADAPGELALPASLDNQRYTIMSYTLYSGATIEAAGPMMFDILAAQYIYGANMTTRAGADSYVFNASGEEFKCIWDAGGHDTFDASNQALAATIDLRAGSFSSIGRKNNGAAASGNIGIAYNVTIEDAVGTAFNDTVTGNAANNHLWGWKGNDQLNGGDGADILDGGTGNDTMTGGLGDDLYLVDSPGDKIVESTTNANGGGIDTVEAYISFSLAPFANVDILQLVGGAALNGTGNAQNNTILGNGADNVLDGGGGADLLKGGAGNDVYIIDNLGDLVHDEGGDSGDTIRTSVLLVGAMGFVENFIYTGSAAWTFTTDASDNLLAGGSGNDTLDGASGNDIVQGNGGNDTLIGFLGNDVLDGGVGNDKLYGGAGNDTYVIDSAGDVVDEEGNADTRDVVQASVSVNLLTLGGGAIEFAYLAGKAALNATGNGLVNLLGGNDAANTLDGGGGADYLIGGGGNDIFIVDDAGDEVVESLAGAAGGIDLVRSGVSFSLASRTNVENLTLTGALAIDATGNALNNVLTGNGAANRLDGGAGNDTMIGDKGDDTYVVDSYSDVVRETIGVDGGVDTVETALDFSLAGLVNVENLKLLTGTGVNAIGNALSNTIIGNAVANMMDGGAGADLLKGGAGNDFYVIDNLGDVIDEEGSADTRDQVQSLFSINLATLAGGAIEFAFLAGVGAVNAAGNGGTNLLAGNDANNVLDGGAGADYLIGGRGSDVFVVDNAGDDLVESVAGAAGGTDLVLSSVTFSLASRANVENLTLYGAGVINGTGNELNNAITGNGKDNTLDGGTGNDVLAGEDGADTLIGGNGIDRLFGGNGDDKLTGGDGLDILTGGAGRDTFDYNHLSEAGDTITDFVLGVAGDILNLADLLDDIGYVGANPFADAILSFAASGANTLVRVDVDGAGAGTATTMATLLNVTLGQADADNYVV